MNDPLENWILSIDDWPRWAQAGVLVLLGLGIAAAVEWAARMAS
jgi:hypothetical protein